MGEPPATQWKMWKQRYDEVAFHKRTEECMFYLAMEEVHNISYSHDRHLLTKR